MVRKMTRAIITAIMLSTILNGCSQATVSSQPLESVKEVKKSKNTEDIAKEFLPKGMEFSAPMYPKRAKSIIKKDIDGDGNKEILFTFKSKEDKYIGGIIVLKEKNHQWKKILQSYGEGKSIYRIDLKDLDGDKNDELLVSTFAGVSVGNALNIYKYDNNTDNFKLVVKDGYHKIYMNDMPNDKGRADGRVELALWKKITGDVYKVDVLKFDGKKLVPAKEVYSYYYNKVIDYYKSKLRKDDYKNSALMWYYLADAQVKAKKPEDALSSIEKIKILNPQGYSTLSDKFDKLQKDAMSYFKN
ncbi:hypothetical protein [Clostridium ganghwense]|uniref:Lipoprotein n=1 Tax=Clostridium ganghwense TaxID=312089 RepID=A0ABT4CMJ5_9CLOT|nr:hypothetical protein [Clostridium ganghwense]MCY6370283.1 hypothetical protein [Clostridium ganghwense]